MTRIIRETNVQTMSDIKSRLVHLSQVQGPAPGFQILGL